MARKVELNLSPTLVLLILLLLIRLFIWTLHRAQMGVFKKKKNADYAPQGLFLAFGSNVLWPYIAVMDPIRLFWEFPPKLKTAFLKNPFRVCFFFSFLFLHLRHVFVRSVRNRKARGRLLYSTKWLIGIYNGTRISPKAPQLALYLWNYGWNSCGKGVEGCGRVWGSLTCKDAFSKGVFFFFSWKSAQQLR